jgi:stage V sporulation protein G
MKITEHKVRLWNDQRLQALITVVFDDCFVVRNIKVIEGREGKLFVAMPSRRLPDGKYVDIAHPINRDFRAYLEQTILDAYREERRLHDEDPDAYARSRQGGEGLDTEEENGNYAPQP